MGDPHYFSVKGGANPHTRTRWGTRRHVDRERAIAQWQRLKDTLVDLDVEVIVVPPDPEQPGLVYPANAGFQSRVDTPEPLACKTFTLANLLPTRAGEKPHYRKVLSSAGFRTSEIDERYRFEGEADFFPAADAHILTHGKVERQRFVPTLAFPPWKRIYGFRTDVDVKPLLEPHVAPRPILEVGLVLEDHYHGDTALCAFGPQRQHLLGYRAAIEPGAWQALRNHFGDHLLELEKADAKRYAANSFSISHGTDSLLVMPAGLSETLRAQIRERSTTPITVDVSEFLKKGGGSVKCMIGDLGIVEPSRPESPLTELAC
jgi:N-dimethylarginine dimethylaminohydrolase